MRHLPKTEYTADDMRRDTSFLVGASYGRLSERARIVALLKSAGIDIPEGVDNA